MLALVMGMPTQAGSAASASALPDISHTLAFENPKECDSAALTDFFDRAAKSGGATLGPLGRVAVSRTRQVNGLVTQRASMRATWNGLTIVALEHVTAPDSAYTEVNFYNLVFAEGGPITGPVLNRMGFGVSRIGQEKEIYDQNTMMNPYYISLEVRGQGSMLKCLF